MTGGSGRDVRRRLDELEDDLDGDDFDPVVIREHVVDDNGDSKGVFCETRVTPDGTTTERYDPPKPVDDLEDKT